LHIRKDEMDRIITASNKYGSLERMLRSLSSRTRKRLPSQNGTTGNPVIARVNLGRWIADCACGGAEIVDPDDRRFFCFSCGNIANDGKYLPVEFPANHQQIENELLNRAVMRSGDFPLAAPGSLPREWIPGETVAELRDQRKAVA